MWLVWAPRPYAGSQESGKAACSGMGTGLPMSSSLGMVPSQLPCQLLLSSFSSVWPGMGPWLSVSGLCSTSIPSQANMGKDLGQCQNQPRQALLPHLTAGRLQAPIPPERLRFLYLLLCSPILSSSSLILDPSASFVRL